MDFLEYTKVRDNPSRGGVWADGMERLSRASVHLNMQSRCQAWNLAKALNKELLLSPLTPDGKHGAGSGCHSLTPDLKISFGLGGYLRHVESEKKKCRKNVALWTAEEIGAGHDHLINGEMRLDDLLGHP